MDSEASVADQTNDGPTEEKEVVHEKKTVQGESTSQPKQTDESGGVEKPKLVESVSSTTAHETDSKQPTEDKEEAPAAEQGSEKEDEVHEGPSPRVVEDKKDDAPPVEEVKKESEDAKASGPEVTVSNKDETSAAVVKVAAEIEKTSRPDEPEIEAPKKEPKEVSTAASPVQELEQVRQEPEVPEPVAKTTAEPLAITAPSEEQPIVLAVVNPSTDASVEHEKKDEAPEVGEAVEASKQQEVPTTETKTCSEFLNEEVDVKKIGSFTLQALATVPGDPTELNDAKAPVVLVKPQLHVEEQKAEKSLVTEIVVEERKEEVKTSETELVGGQKEEKDVGIEPTLTGDTKETGEQRGDPAAEATGASSEKEKPSEGVGKVVDVQKDIGGSDASTEKVAEEPKDESVKDIARVVQASRGIDPEGKISEAAVESIVGPEKADEASSEKVETGERKDETEKTAPRDLAESSEGGGAGSKTDVDVQKSETPAKSKTLMSKVKHSIGKVKKAIIGKSLSSKMMSAEPKDDQLKAK